MTGSSMVFVKHVNRNPLLVGFGLPVATFCNRMGRKCTLMPPIYFVLDARRDIRVQGWESKHPSDPMWRPKFEATITWPLEEISANRGVSDFNVPRMFAAV